MKNIPIFTAVNGTASLILQEIPISGKAYVILRSVWTTAEALLEECRQFCRAAGAETVFVSYGTEPLPAAHAYDLIAMTCPKASLPQPRQTVELIPLTPENGGAYLEIYNRCFRQVPGAATYGQRDLRRLYGKDLAWLVRRQDAWAAVAEIGEEGLEAIGVLSPFRGLGFDLAATVLRLVPAEMLRLKVAGTNRRALELYARLGFSAERVVSRWWRLQESLCNGGTDVLY